MYFINSLWESILLKQLAAVFILCSKFFNFQIFKFLDNKSTLTELNRFNRFKKFCAICELTLYQSNVNVNIFIQKNDYVYLDISASSSY